MRAIATTPLHDRAHSRGRDPTRRHACAAQGAPRRLEEPAPGNAGSMHLKALPTCRRVHRFRAELPARPSCQISRQTWQLTSGASVGAHSLDWTAFLGLWAMVAV